MAELVVVNTGPLVTLARAECLDVIEKLPLTFVCPPQVRAELDEGVAAGHLVVAPAWLETRALARPLEPVARATLDEGEAAVIQLALEQRIRRVCIDDLKGRRTALAVGLEVIGALGLLVRAKQLGVIPALRPVLERLERAGAWYSAELVARVLAGVGE
jgi:predicted nucleic acid-binding protein